MQRLKYAILIEPGSLSPLKMNHKLITGWTASLRCRDVFEGEADGNCRHVVHITMLIGNTPRVRNLVENDGALDI